MLFSVSVVRVYAINSQGGGGGGGGGGGQREGGLCGNLRYSSFYANSSCRLQTH